MLPLHLKDLWREILYESEKPQFQSSKYMLCQKQFFLLDKVSHEDSDRGNKSDEYTMYN